MAVTASQLLVEISEAAPGLLAFCHAPDIEGCMREVAKVAIRTE